MGSHGRGKIDPGIFAGRRTELRAGIGARHNSAARHRILETVSREFRRSTSVHRTEVLRRDYGWARPRYECGERGHRAWPDNSYLAAAARKFQRIPLVARHFRGRGCSAPRLRQIVSGECSMSLPGVSPAPTIGLAWPTEAPAICPNSGHFAPTQPEGKGYTLLFTARRHWALDGGSSRQLDLPPLRSGRGMGREYTEWKFALWPLEPPTLPPSALSPPSRRRGSPPFHSVRPAGCFDADMPVRPGAPAWSATGPTSSPGTVWPGGDRWPQSPLVAAPASSPLPACGRPSSHGLTQPA